MRGRNSASSGGIGGHLQLMRPSGRGPECGSDDERPSSGCGVAYVPPSSSCMVPAAAADWAGGGLRLGLAAMHQRLAGRLGWFGAAVWSYGVGVPAATREGRLSGPLGPE